MKIKTKTGETFHVPDGLSGDFRFIKAVKDMQSGDNSQALGGAVELVHALFCDEAEEQRFLQSLADDSGRVPLDRVMPAVNELLTEATKQSKAVKNS